MLIRNEWSVENNCPSQHQRCGMFIDSKRDTVLDVLSGPVSVRISFRKTQLFEDLKLARTFRKIWEASKLVEAFERGIQPEKSTWAVGPLSPTR
jgi:hypothetical protein